MYTRLGGTGHDRIFSLGLRDLQQRCVPVNLIQEPVNEYICRNTYSCIISNDNLV